MSKERRAELFKLTWNELASKARSMSVMVYTGATKRSIVSAIIEAEKPKQIERPR